MAIRMLSDMDESDGGGILESMGHLHLSALKALVDEVWPAVLEAALPKECAGCSYIWHACASCAEANDCMRALAVKVNAGEIPGFLP